MATWRTTRSDRDGGGGRGAGTISLGRLLFVVFIGASLMPLLVSNVWGYLQTRSYVEESARREVRDIAAREASKAVAFFREIRDLVGSVVSDNAHMEATVQALRDASTPEERAPHVRTLQRHLAAKAGEQGRVEEFVVLSEVGDLLASSRENAQTGADWHERVCHTAQVGGAELAGFEYGGAEPIMVVAAPLDVTGDGQRDATFCGLFRFTIHHELVGAHEGPSTDPDLYLLDGRGDVLCGSFEDIATSPSGADADGGGATTGHHGHDHADGVSEHGHEVAPRAREAARILAASDTREAWEATYRREGDEPVFAALAPVPYFGLGILVEIPESRAFAPLERLKWQAVLGGSVLALLVTVLVYFASRRISHPLRRLSGAAHRMSNGVLDQHVSPEGPREVVTLANAFNQMSSALKTSREHLERRLAQRTAALRRSTAFAELLLDSIDHLVVVVDRGSRVIKANAAARRVYGEDVVGQPYLCSEPERDRSIDGPCASCAVHRTLETGAPETAERSQRTAHGHEIVALHTFPVLSPGGEVESAVEIGRIVTDERRVQAQMVHQEKMAAFGLLAAGVAHEVGNPLAAIQSELRMARARPSPERVRDTLQVVDEQVVRISRLLRELVDVARRKRDDVVLVSMAQAVETVTRLLGHDSRSRNVRLEVETAGGVPGVRAREDDLIQILLNLGMNALDAVDGDGRILFRTLAREGYVVTRVVDTGGGIPPEARPHLFEPFYTTKEGNRGTGLGLFVSRSIAERLGGRLVLERSGAEGTMFTLMVPAAPTTGRRLGRGDEASEARAS